MGRPATNDSDNKAKKPAMLRAKENQKDTDASLIHVKLIFGPVDINPGQSTLYCCGICRKQCTSRYQLKIHTRSHTGKKGNTVKVRDKISSTNVPTENHTKTHSAVKTWVCDICGKTCSNRYNLKIDIRIHTGEKPHICEICGSSFRYGKTYKAHMTAHSQSVMSVSKCNVCDKTFTQSLNLEKHMRIHTGEKPYKCDKCGTRFNEKGSFWRRTRNRICNKFYKCDVCNKGLSESYNLHVHRKNAYIR